jgi:dTDP-4-dehydrorhamnose 3,5-epimerase
VAVTVSKVTIEGPLLLEGKIHMDARGAFMETYRADRSGDLLNGGAWVQDNVSRSTTTGTVRGLHWQSPPFAQAKLVSVLKGAIMDVVIDLRLSSGTFGKAATFHLSDAANQQLFVPIGFAHGFCTLSDDTIVAYKCSSPYHASAERSLLWCDPSLSVAWPISREGAIVSDKDGQAPLLSQLGQQDLFDL